MLRTIIIDDELSSIEVMRQIISSYCTDIEIIGIADGVQSGINLINEIQPDLVLLDIHLHDGTGFDLLKAIEVIRFKFIFVTAYEKYAIEAINFSALTIILKPIDPVEFSTVINKAKLVTENESLSLRLNAFFTNFNQKSEERKKIVLDAYSGTYLLNINDIIKCEAINNQTRFVFINGEEILINKTLKEYEMLFRNQQFFKIDKSNLINIGHFKKFGNTDPEFIVMDDDSAIPISQNKKTELQHILYNK